MKQGQKRIIDDDFQQVEECYVCSKLFWAASIYELGNWQTLCGFCEKEERTKENNRQNCIQKNGTKLYGYKKRIRGWKLKNEIFANPKYSIDNLELGGINRTNIDDKIRELKKLGIKKIVWNPILFYLVDYFSRTIGYFQESDTEFVFMGVAHVKGEKGNYRYKK